MLKNILAFILGYFSDGKRLYLKIKPHPLFRGINTVTVLCCCWLRSVGLSFIFCYFLSSTGEVSDSIKGPHGDREEASLTELCVSKGERQEGKLTFFQP